MAVESVNNNSNAGLYGLGGAVIGAGAGTATAYLTKPYLKDGAPTDSFTRNIYEKFKENFPEETKEFEAGKKSINEAKTIDELKNLFVKSNEKIQPLKIKNEKAFEFLKSIGIKQEYIDQLKNIKTTEDAGVFFGQMFDKEYAGKNVDEVKNAMNELFEKAEKQTGKFFFEQVWDKDKKEFKNCEEGFGKAIKDAAKGIQGKYALIYGSIAAAILGIVTYFVASGNKSTQTPSDKINTSV